MKSADKTIRVGILCFSQKRNYGAKIVAWALQEKVKSLLPDNAEVGLIYNENHQETKTFDGVSPLNIATAMSFEVFAQAFFKRLGSAAERGGRSPQRAKLSLTASFFC